MKIVYAAGNRKSSYESLKRFIETYSSIHTVRSAAYSSHVSDQFVDWNLEACFNLGDKEIIDFQSETFLVLLDEVKSFAPDLIISDLDPFVSHIGFELGIPVYQVSPFLLHFGAEGGLLKLYARYSALFAPHAKNRDIMRYIVDNSDKRLVLSHLGDIDNPPRLYDGFEFVRPSYKEIVYGKDLIRGDPMVLSDYYYNHIPHRVIIDYPDLGSIVACAYDIKYGLSDEYVKKEFDLSINDRVPFLSSFIKRPDIRSSKG